MVERGTEPLVVDQEQADAAVLDKMRAQLSGPRTMKEPGSPEWCWQTIGHLQLMWKFFESAEVSYLTVLEEATDHKVWEIVPEGNPFGSKENMVSVLNIGDEQAARERLRREALQSAALRVQRNPSFAKANTIDRLLTSIARERPDILDRAQQGEFKSVAEAAKAAGIDVRRTKTVTLSPNVDRLANRLIAHYTPDQFTALARRMLQLRREEKRHD